MPLTYNAFTCTFTFSGCTGNSDANAVFDFLCLPENIHSMIVCSNLKLPALSGIVKELEDRFSAAPQFPLTDNRNRQIVGRMTKFILNHFGYEPCAGGSNDRMKLRNFSEAKLFKTASVYVLNNTPVNFISMQIV